MKKTTLLGAIFKSVGYIALFFACQFVASAFVQAMILALRLQVESFEAATASAELLFNKYLSEILILSALLFLGIVFAIKRKNFISETSLHKASPLTLFASLLMGFACFYLAGYLIGILTSLFPSVQASQEEYMDQYNAIQAAKPNAWLEFFSSCILGAFVEELLCRGILWNLFRKHIKPWSFVVLSGAVFAVMHGNLYQVVFTLPLGMVLAYLVCRTGSVLPAFVLHAAFNSGNYLVSLPELVGLEEGSGGETVVLVALSGFFLLCIPLSLILFQNAFEGKFALVSEKTKTIRFVPQRPGDVEWSNPKGAQEMASPEYLIVGLGNPGDRYAQTRHNCGFLALDYIALREKITMNRVRFRAFVGEGVMEGKKVLFMKPQTFMNLSGESVREAASFYKIPPENILVIFDDVSFKPGVFRIRKEGSAGGHNGVKSVIEALSSQDFPRVKMGVGKPPEGWELMNWVLAPLPREDEDRIVAEMEDIYGTARLFVQGELDLAISRYSGKEH